MTSGKTGRGASRRWSDGETSALVGAWGQLYLRRNRSSLRMEDWLAVCSAVNAHGGDANRTVAQCRTRVWTLKAQYKEEVAKRRPTSGWRHFAHLQAFLADPSAPPPGLPVKKEKAEEEVKETSGCVGGSAGGGRTKVPAKRHYSSLQGILERSGGRSLAKTSPTVKEEETVKDEEVVGCGCELAGGPAAGVTKLVAEMTKLAEVFERVERERFKFEKEIHKVKEEMKTENSQ